MGFSKRSWLRSFVCVLLVWLSALEIGIVGVEGATDCAPASGSLTIKTSSDITSLAQCSKFTGNVVIAADGPDSVSLNGLTAVSGNIDIENVAKLTSLSSSTLTAVSSFTLNNLPKLSNLSFPALTNFSSLKWYHLPALEDCELASGSIEGEIQEITIVETSLKSLDWLKWPVGSQLNITSNTQLSSFNIPYDSINTGSAYTISGNTALNALDVSSLSGIYGGLDVEKNNVDTLSFEKLETIGGFVQLSGDYKNISMLALNKINGALSVDSSEDISALCSSLEEKRLTGHYDCASNIQKSTSATNPSQTASPGSSATANPHEANGDARGGKKLHSSAQIAIGIAALLLTILLAIGAFFYFRRRSRAKVREINQQDSKTDSKTAEIDSMELSSSRISSPSSPRELETPTFRLELTGGKEILEMPGVVPQELDAYHGRCELNTPITPVSPAASISSVNSIEPLIRHELPA